MHGVASQSIQCARYEQGRPSTWLIEGASGRTQCARYEQGRPSIWHRKRVGEDVTDGGVELGSGRRTDPGSLGDELEAMEMCRRRTGAWHLG